VAPHRRGLLYDRAGCDLRSNYRAATDTPLAGKAAVGANLRWREAG
jgi:hypothetical protein